MGVGVGSEVGVGVAVTAGVGVGLGVAVGVGVGAGAGGGVGVGSGAPSSVTLPIAMVDGTYEVTLNHNTTWTLASVTSPTMSYCPGGMLPGNDRSTI